jgi:hypothetical protein
MTLDRAHFTDLIVKQADIITSFSKTMEAKPTGKELAHLKFRGDVSTDPVFYLCGMHGQSLSNHQRLAYDAFEIERKRDIAEIKEVLTSGVPALNQDDIHFEVTVVGKGKRETRIALSLLQMPLTSNSGMTCSNALKKFFTAIDRIEDLPAPRDRVFRVHTNTIRAHDEFAAYRIWAACLAPDLFDPEDNQRTSSHATDIHEILSGQAAHAALVK